MTINRKLLFVILVFLAFSRSFFSQVSAERTVIRAANDLDKRLDSLSIYPNSFRVYTLEGMEVNRDKWRLDFQKSTITMLESVSDSLRFEFQVLPYDFSKSFQLRDTSQIYTARKGDYEKFKIEQIYSVDDVFGGTELSKNGSISRGVTFGNKQNLGINSSLNLELSGQLTPNLKVLASVSDANLPIQPDGNTNKLQEFDQVYIQIYNERMKLVTGDFWISKPEGYFMNYKKRGQGLTAEYKWKDRKENTLSIQSSAALSKGKFNRQIIQGIEANQGPYRLRGAENEPFIQVLAGTERVYIDGRLLTRGQEFDYIIDYNSSELTFTSRNLITKDIRIVVEFQYSDQNYARSLAQVATSYTFKKGSVWMNVYQEQDAKNQPLQQSLTGQQKLELGLIGDNLIQARLSSVDSVGYLENQILYRMTDSLGYDSVLVFSTLPSVAVYRANFLFVGAGNGDYVFDSYNALGKVYRWVAPVNGVSQGDYIPARLLITPKSTRMMNIGAKYQLTKSFSIETDNAITDKDLNTFSNLNNDDNIGASHRTLIKQELAIKTKKDKEMKLENRAEIEWLSANFSPIEQYRKVEFDRDWNVRGKGYVGQQFLANVGTKLMAKEKGNASLNLQHFSIGNSYRGNRLFTEGNWTQKGWDAKWDGSFTNASAGNENSYLRHRISLSKQIGGFKVGFQDDHERNVFQSQDSLSKNSYQFYDHQYFFSNADSSKVYYKIFYRERYDQFSDTFRLKPTAKAQTAGMEIRISEMKNQRLTLIGAYRKLSIRDSVLITQAPENSMVGRLEYETKLWKSALTWNTFYEVGSGLEQKRQFQYLKVNDGQGIYTWIDYNLDGIKDLNEFEVAQYIDQASYIRVFVPSSDYVRTYSNELNQSIFWRPEKLWAKKSGVLKILALFSDQARIRINRKLNAFDPQTAFNPFATNVQAEQLISTGSTIRNSLFFNRTSNVINGEYTFQDVRSKTLLASGFDSKQNTFHSWILRWNLSNKWTIEGKTEIGRKLSLADYTAGRNYNYDYQNYQPSLIFQPSTNLRLTLDGRFTTKYNLVQFGGETCKIQEIGSTFKFNQTDKGSLQGELKMNQMNFVGNINSAVGFELLESLRPGTNFTWNFGYQRNLSKNLQMSINYLGRKSEGVRFIHSGGMEVRAFF